MTRWYKRIVVSWFRVSSAVSFSLNQEFHRSPPAYVRGDVNDDFEVNISDGVFALEWLFQGGLMPNCVDATDANASGSVDIADPIYIFLFLFSGGDAPPFPFPDCGELEPVIECGITNCG